MRLAPLAFLLALAACDSLADRTYPGAGNYTALSIAQVGEAEAGRYNTEALVSSVYVCPPEAFCLTAGSITLGAPDGTEPLSVTVLVDEPDQFEAGRRGLFSVEVHGETGGFGDRWISLVGYDWR